MGADALAPLPFSLLEKVAGVSRPDEGFGLKGETRLARETLTPDPSPVGEGRDRYSSSLRASSGSMIGTPSRIG